MTMFSCTKTTLSLLLQSACCRHNYRKQVTAILFHNWQTNLSEYSPWCHVVCKERTHTCPLLLCRQNVHTSYSRAAVKTKEAPYNVQSSSSLEQKFTSPWPRALKSTPGHFDPSTAIESFLAPAAFMHCLSSAVTAEQFMKQTTWRRANVARCDPTYSTYHPECSLPDHFYGMECRYTWSEQWGTCHESKVYFLLPVECWKSGHLCCSHYLTIAMWY